MKRVLFTIVVLLHIGLHTIFAGPNALKEITAVKSYAKAGATTAARIGLESLYHNPAGLTEIQGFMVSTSYSSFFDNFYSSMGFSLGYKINDQLFFGFGIPVKIISDIPESIDINGMGQQVGTFSDIETCGILSLAYQINENIHFGISSTYQYHSVLKNYSKGFSVDAGLILDYQIVSIGCMAQNITGEKIEWDTGYKEEQEKVYSVGIGLNPVENFNLYANSVFEDKDVIYNCAGEIRLTPLLSIPFGLADVVNRQDFRIGLELKNGKSSINYVYGQNEFLGTIHKVSLEINI
ncbi:hypothetical protein ACFLZV_02365 [Candidatus Margulisiibacteriota bacterium]